MKRCKTCGHTNGRLRQAKSWYTGDVLPGQFVCVSDDWGGCGCFVDEVPA